ncbi:MAG: DUF6174 domain-containing protein [Gemmataceae bacterium]
MAFPFRKSGWIWFFLFLAVTGSLAIAIPLVYNVQQQLRPEQLSAARRLWQEKAPANYDLEYQVRRQFATDSEDHLPDLERFRLEVRGGEIISIKKDGEPLPPSEGSHHSVDALFDLMERNLEMDDKSQGPRNFAHAQFDKSDGHPTVYVHRVMGSRQRLQIIIQLTRIEEGGGKVPQAPSDPAK